MTHPDRSVRLTQAQDYQFDVDFGTPGPLLRAGQDEDARRGVHGWLGLCGAGKDRERGFESVRKRERW